MAKVINLFSEEDFKEKEVEQKLNEILNSDKFDEKMFCAYLSKLING